MTDATAPEKRRGAGGPAPGSGSPPKCVLLAGRHQGLAEALRGPLETAFEVVVVVPDETAAWAGGDR
ncbi:MAG TPA: hypothetical protein PK598_09725, partial [Thermoanaerobaculia bacterium]|nr:hypothetical protein [Thermoanaerobaculia bacterium]